MTQSGKAVFVSVASGLLQRFSIGHDIFRRKISFDNLRKICVGTICQALEEMNEFGVQTIAA
jgi:hypothetical protein